MLIDFFLHLKAKKLPVSTREFLTLLEALKEHVAGNSIDDFYFLARTCLVKDETHYDKFDQAFGEYFKGVTAVPGLDADIPEEWLKMLMKKHLTPEEKAKLEKLGWDKLMEEFKKRLEEQKERHAGGSKWIGTGGSSPFGHGGYHPEGIRIGGESAGNRTAIKVWENREYRNLDDTVELGTRNIKIALRRLRRFAREGAEDELDLDGTIAGTARNAGWLDIRMRPERHNKVKVLLFLDIGGSMDDHIKVCEELFSAAKSEFKHLEYYYFHNCIYDYVWKDNRRRHGERFPLWDVMHKYGEDYKVVVVGDATMSPYEILQPGGSVEYSNEEAGAVWLQRMLDTWPRAVWLNPEPERLWDYRHSIELIRTIFNSRMFPLTLAGLERAMRELNK
ncbi:vWA domain-containing protein [Sulfuritalea hydrogenivorans]|uniref:von Willebrand factor A n=1 Tax=Sulfuritalea hydrogenivorans sk43H TaxID=1223802 RepID=W0SCU0_9PROT|nr:VWA domain-containing protein [Sulfuritalea hydrogenivorans]BAO28836.1 von Willebrand factor A [Sulfuritalea hydrogenivorans sk43H]